MCVVMVGLRGQKLQFCMCLYGIYFFLPIPKFCTLHSADPQQERLLQQPYIVRIGVSSPASGASVCVLSNHALLGLY